MLSDPKEVAERKAILGNRRCPSCGTRIKLYQFNCLLLPFEHLALDYFLHENFASLKSPIFSFQRMPLRAMNKIVFTSTCECGHISFWNCQKEDIDVLASQEMRDKGYGIDMFYHKDTIRHLFHHAKDKKLKEDLKAILDLYPDEQNGDQ